MSIPHRFKKMKLFKKILKIIIKKRPKIKNKQILMKLQKSRKKQM